MSTRQETSITSGLTRRTALTQAAVGGIAAIALSTTRVAAQETEPLPALELARRAGDLYSALVPVVVRTHTQSDEELDQSATASLDQLKEQQDVTEEEASSLQQILDEVSSEDDDPTKI